MKLQIRWKSCGIWYGWKFRIKKYCFMWSMRSEWYKKLKISTSWHGLCANIWEMLCRISSVMPCNDTMWGLHICKIDSTATLWKTQINFYGEVKSSKWSNIVHMVILSSIYQIEFTIFSVYMDGPVRFTFLRATECSTIPCALFRIELIHLPLSHVLRNLSYTLTHM